MIENKCPNCKKMVSEKEIECPYCGIPLYFSTNSIVKGTDIPLTQKESEGCGCTFFIIAAVILLIAIIISYG